MGGGPCSCDGPLWVPAAVVVAESVASRRAVGSAAVEKTDVDVPSAAKV